MPPYVYNVFTKVMVWTWSLNRLYLQKASYLDILYLYSCILNSRGSYMSNSLSLEYKYQSIAGGSSQVVDKRTIVWIAPAISRPEFSNTAKANRNCQPSGKKELSKLATCSQSRQTVIGIKTLWRHPSILQGMMVLLWYPYRTLASIARVVVEALYAVTSCVL